MQAVVTSYKHEVILSEPRIHEDQKWCILGKLYDQLALLNVELMILWYSKSKCHLMTQARAQLPPV